MIAGNKEGKNGNIYIGEKMEINRDIITGNKQENNCGKKMRKYLRAKIKGKNCAK